MITSAEAQALPFAGLAPVLRRLFDAMTASERDFSSLVPARKPRFGKLLTRIAILAAKAAGELEQRIARNLEQDCRSAQQRYEARIAGGDGKPISSASALKVVRVPWNFLPPGELGWKAIGVAVNRLRDEHRGKRVDDARLRFARSLQPKAIYKGLDEFDSYFAFVFQRANTTRALLENPVEGNAAYIFGRDWKTLSRLTKAELLENQRSGVVRIIHDGGWQGRIVDALRPVVHVPRGKLPRR